MRRRAERFRARLADDDWLLDIGVGYGWHWAGDGGGFSEEPRFNGVEDYELWLRLAKAEYRFGFVPEVLGNYRVHRQGITQWIGEYHRHLLNVLEAHYHLRRALRENPFDWKAWLLCLANPLGIK